MEAGCCDSVLSMMTRFLQGVEKRRRNRTQAIAMELLPNFQLLCNALFMPAQRVRCISWRRLSTAFFSFGGLTLKTTSTRCSHLQPGIDRCGTAAYELLQTPRLDLWKKQLNLFMTIAAESTRVGASTLASSSVLRTAALSVEVRSTYRNG